MSRALAVAVTRGCGHAFGRGLGRHPGRCIGHGHGHDFSRVAVAVAVAVAMALAMSLATVTVAEPVDTEEARFRGGGKGRWTGRLPTITAKHGREPLSAATT